ncbi:MAG: hypothetical protein UY01_C0004G0005 [Candidatus Nomurabacteria bacterium GW2011_GWB1_47_6]|uniref:Uncharacterized protein n=1 Tax=Candidatus Nomurabacteria bacterium GW2011_GWB1_47_6 TaxID=1618749 RepID=A0A0G1VC97_9BACT|nr:MAG: hypothetical protein UY01_C0004G0005 [Candidatus Nomurabacteria bacterium GW2011_GWB1_47_6]
MKKYFFILIIFILATGFLVTLPGGNLTPESIRYVKVAGQRIRVDLAISPEAQTKGLAGRTGLSEGEGMLFIFLDERNEFSDRHHLDHGKYAGGPC